MESGPNPAGGLPLSCLQGLSVLETVLGEESKAKTTENSPTIQEPQREHHGYLDVRVEEETSDSGGQEPAGSLEEALMPTPPSAKIADAPHPPSCISAPTTRGCAESCLSQLTIKLPQDLATVELNEDCPDKMLSKKQELLVDGDATFSEDDEWMRELGDTTINTMETSASTLTPLVTKKGSLTPEMPEPPVDKIAQLRQTQHC